MFNRKLYDAITRIGDAGHAGIGWALALIVAALAALSATTGICVGCELYLLAARRRPVTS